jgi:segregation and condensation protein B
MARLEAVLLVAPAALSARKLAQFAALSDPGEVRRLAEALNAAYDRDGSAFRIEPVADGYRLLTRPEFSPWLDRMHQRQAAQRLSPPALETLTVVAYRQPITRADLEAIRGVQSAEMLKQLMDRGLVRIVGEDDSLGRPFLYGTTREFLETFGFRSLDELPDRAELAPAAASSGGPDSSDAPDESLDPHDLEIPAATHAP